MTEDQKAKKKIDSEKNALGFMVMASRESFGEGAIMTVFKVQKKKKSSVTSE